ncbi:MAG: PIG-L family deacetylase [Saprospiraceae bacterium]|nr:PIG-L family deacetylase [Saprospiraceae bacterium]
MLKLNLPHDPQLRILCLGAHCDDIEIGCGGTLLRLLDEYDVAVVKWIVFSGNEMRKKEARVSAEYFTRGQKAEIKILNFPDARFSFKGLEIKAFFESIKSFEPSLIFTHCQNDQHQDHRFINQLSWNTFRNHMILEYEIPKFDGDLGQPTCYVPLSLPFVEMKVDTILRCFESQRSKHWFDAETFRSLLRLRGMECASASRYAEAFYVRKWLI